MTARATPAQVDGGRIDAIIKLAIDHHTEFSLMLANAVADRHRRYPRGSTGKK